MLDIARYERHLTRAKIKNGAPNKGARFLLDKKCIEEVYSSGRIEYQEGENSLRKMYFWQEGSLVKNLLILKLSYLFRQSRLNQSYKKSHTEWRLVQLILRIIFKAQKNRKVRRLFGIKHDSGIDDYLLQESDWRTVEKIKKTFYDNRVKVIEAINENNQNIKNEINEDARLGVLSLETLYKMRILKNQKNDNS